MILMHLKIRNRQKPVIFVLFLTENPYELPLPALLSGDRRPQSMKDLGVNNSMFYLSCYKKILKDKVGVGSRKPSSSSRLLFAILFTSGHS
jgi:hypothetical protein